MYKRTSEAPINVRPQPRLMVMCMHIVHASKVADSGNKSHVKRR